MFKAVTKFCTLNPYSLSWDDFANYKMYTPPRGLLYTYSKNYNTRNPNRSQRFISNANSVCVQYGNQYAPANIKHASVNKFETRTETFFRMSVLDLQIPSKPQSAVNLDAVVFENIYILYRLFFSEFGSIFVVLNRTLDTKLLCFKIVFNVQLQFVCLTNDFIY